MIKYANLLKYNNIKLLAHYMDRLYDLRTMVYGTILDHALTVLYNTVSTIPFEMYCDHPEMMRWLIKCDDKYITIVYRWFESDNLEVYKWLYHKGYLKRNSNSLCHSIARNYSKIIEWHKGIEISNRVVHFVISHSNLDKIIWLHNNHSDLFTSDAIDFAAELNEIEILEWLYNNRQDGYTCRAVGWCIINEQFKMATLLKQKLNNLKLI